MERVPSVEKIPIPDSNFDKMEPEKIPAKEGQMTNEIPEKSKLEERGTWGKQLDFLLACIGYAVGLGNIWRFPYLCYRNGGGAFLIPYFLMMLAVGMPLFFMELAFGQYAREGPITIWKAAPLFKGIGYAMVCISGIVTVYYNLVLAWAVFFFFKSFTKELPWKGCNNIWNTDSCGYSNGTNITYENSNNETFTVSANESTIPAEEYWRNEVLQLTEGIEDMGSMRWQLAACLFLAWVIVYACIFKGVKSSGKVVYFTATFPYVVLTILLIRGLTLEGAMDGIYFYLNPKWETLKDAKVWNDAATQIFYSLGPAWGGILTFASFNKFHNNCYRDALVVPLINCFTSFYAGFVVFSTLGFMSAKTGIPIQNVSTTGPDLVFITYPEAIAQMPVAPLWSFLFFFMLFLVGLDTQFGMSETFICGIVDEFPKYLRPHKSLFALAVCVVCFFLGLPLCMQGGIYVFELINWYCCWLSLMLVGMFECLVIGWVYGADRLLANTREMIGFMPRIWRLYQVAWRFVTPSIILAITIFSMNQYVPVYYDKYVYPGWAEAIGWMLTFVSLIPIPVMMVVQVHRESEGETLLEKIQNLMKPTPDWEKGEEIKSCEEEVVMKSVSKNGLPDPAPV
ncbi:sodium- and chloride-dependent glycine transporter 1-like isoform X2 [Anneissia japonica]|uniref:sodium- and chloride-dependent glycine transporter 1-like isoform X2 n=1 Tax=Anneissia japonica TaxID=1529436 RepID=UPI001425578D|nr:sodium- and chloride-dependent glycine transporter 1-like isoform X2 [Anneissia japonica]